MEGLRNDYFASPEQCQSEKKQANPKALEIYGGRYEVDVQEDLEPITVAGRYE